LSLHDVDTATAQAVGAADKSVVREQLWGAVADSDEYAAVATIFGAVDATADILIARGVPASTLSPELEILATQLHEFPRSQRLPNAAQSALADATSPATDPRLET
jgi:hypothetical protein